MESNNLIFIVLRPRLAGKVSKIYIEIGKITAIEEMTERGEICGSRIWGLGSQFFDVKETPEEVIEMAMRLFNRALDLQLLK